MQKINNITNIYNPNDIVSFISTTENEDGDIFMVTNSEYENITTRIIYGIKSDGDIYYSNKEGFYKIAKFNDTYGNIYPMISFIKIKGKDYLASLSHDRILELYDINEELYYNIFLFYVINANSNIYKNTFIHLKYYNYTNYILNAYIDRKESNKTFRLQKIKY